jgi:hypothetical protein
MSTQSSIKGLHDFAKAEKLLSRAVSAAGYGKKMGMGKKRISGKGFLDAIKSIAGPLVKVAKAVPIISTGLAATGNPMAAGAAKALGLGKRKTGGRKKRGKGPISSILGQFGLGK